MRGLLLLPVLLFAACQTPPNIDIPAVINTTVSAMDKNKDGALTNQEIKSSQNDPMFWINVGTALLALFGLSKANSASKGVDELYDRTHKPTPQ